MAYSEFGARFADTYNQWLEDEADRKKAKKLIEASLKKTIASEERGVERAGRAKVQSALEALTRRGDSAPMREALIESGISTEQKPLAPRLYEESLRPLTPMQAIRRDLPSGDTIEDIRKRQSYLAGITGAERIAAAEPEAIAAADLEARARTRAAEGVLDKQLEMEMKKLREVTDFKRGEGSFDAELDGEKRTARDFAIRGLSFDDWRKDANERVGGKWQSQGIGSEIHNAFLDGQRSRRMAGHAAKLKLDIDAAEREIRKNMPVRKPMGPEDRTKAQKDAWLESQKKASDFFLSEVRRKFNKHEAGTLEHRIVNDAIDAVADQPQIGLRDMQRKISGDIRLAVDNRNKAIAIAKQDPAWGRASESLTKWWKNSLKNMPEGTHPSRVASKLGVDEGAMEMPPALRALKPEHDDLTYDAYLKHKIGWFDRVNTLNRRLRKMDRGALFTADVDFHTTLSGLEEIGRGLTPVEEAAGKALTSGTLEAFDRIGGDEKRLNEIDSVEERQEVKDHIYRLRGEVTSANYKRALLSAGAFKELAETLGKSPDLKFFTVREPESKATMFSFNQRTQMEEAAPFPVRIVVKPGHVMTKAQEEEALDEAYEEARWVKDPLTGKWIYPPHIDPDYKGK